MRRTLLSLLVLALVCCATPAAAQRRATISTLLGGPASESACPRCVAVAADGDIIVTGDASSPVSLIDFGPSPVDMRVAPAGADLFVARLDAAGTAIKWITYLGGNSADQSRAVAVGADGSVYVVADTVSTNLTSLPGLNDLRAPGAAPGDVLVVRLSANGSARAYSALLGGSGTDNVTGLVVNGDGSVVISGYTSSDALTSPATAFSAGLQPARAGGSDGYLLALDDQALAVTRGTFLGGSGDDEIRSLSVDGSGRFVIAGRTKSGTAGGGTPLPTVAALGGTRGAGAVPFTDLGGESDAFLAALSPALSALVFSTYFGGTQQSGFSVEWGAAAVAGPGGSYYLVGRTDATDLPTVNALDATYAAGLQRSFTDGFAARLTWNGTSLALAYSTYVGGTRGDALDAASVDAAGVLWAAGFTSDGLAASGFPAASPDAFDGSFAGVAPLSDAFVVGIAPAGTLSYLSFYGGAASDTGSAIASDAAGDVYLVGHTSSSDLASATPPYFTPGAVDTAVQAQDLFLLRLTDSTGPTLTSVTPPAGLPAGGNVVTLTGTGFMVGASVKFGSASASAVLVTSRTAITATVPAGSLGSVAVSVTNPDDRSASLPAGYAYVVLPTLADVIPALGPITGGTVVVLTGSAFQPGATVKFGAASAASVTFDGATQLTVVTPAGAIGVVDVTVVNPDLGSATLPAAFTFPSDYDGDQLGDDWEVGYFGNLAQTGSDDPDRDGFTNLEEQQEGTSPIEAVRYFAEGANGEGLGFQTRLAVLNPHEVGTTVTFEFFPLGGTPLTHGPVVLGPHQRFTLDTWAEVPGLAAASFSTVVRSTFGVVADRTMTWDATGYASHAETAIAKPRVEWYLAEGATHSGFHLFYLLQNPNPTAALVQVTYLRSGQTPLTATCSLPGRTRKNIYVNVQLCPEDAYVGARPTPDHLAADDVSAVFTVTNATPIIVERAMYRGAGFAAGTATAAVSQPATQWFLAEGATGDLFDTYVLLANPSDTDARFEMDLLRLTASPSLLPVTEIADPFFCAPRPAPCTLVVPRKERRTVRLDAIPGAENDGLSTVVRVTNGVGVLVERAMWWPGAFQTWVEGHASFGATTTGTRWGLADGEVGGPRSVATYVLVANTASFDAEVRATLVFEDGTTASTQIPVAANARANFNFTPGTIAAYPGLENLFPASTVTSGVRFGVLVESLATGDGTAPLVVERAMYSSDGRPPTFLPYWPAGTNALGTKLR